MKKRDRELWIGILIVTAGFATEVSALIGAGLYGVKGLIVLLAIFGIVTFYSGKIYFKEKEITRKEILDFFVEEK